MPGRISTALRQCKPPHTCLWEHQFHHALDSNGESAAQCAATICSSKTYPAPPEVVLEAKGYFFPHVWPLSSLHFFFSLWLFFLTWFPLLFSTHVCPHREEQHRLFPTLKRKQIGHSVPQKAPGGQRDIILVLFTLLIIRPSKRPQAGNPS